ncbi:unnamed protein product [Protopolystoma xenopodis]|uniref:Uncharacterized protein n=1 Tax=Protopolystoma xenopodis TaxID=117903 RepID=A0A3S5FC12_9PLAT|nr:unnamed protein product [Protopolystoma xenopodis]
MSKQKEAAPLQPILLPRVGDFYSHRAHAIPATHGTCRGRFPTDPVDRDGYSQMPGVRAGSPKKPPGWPDDPKLETAVAPLLNRPPPAPSPPAPPTPELTAAAAAAAVATAWSVRLDSWNQASRRRYGGRKTASQISRRSALAPAPSVRPPIKSFVGPRSKSQTVTSSVREAASEAARS